MKYISEQLRDQRYTWWTYPATAALSSREKQEHQRLLADLVECNVPFSSRFTLFCCSADRDYTVIYNVCIFFNSSVTLLLLLFEKHCVYTLKPVQGDPIILQLHVKTIQPHTAYYSKCCSWGGRHSSDPFVSSGRKRLCKLFWKMYGWEGNGIKSELPIRAVPELFSPAYIQSQYKVWKCATVSLATSVLVNQTVGGNVPGQWIAIAHASEALRLSLLWVKHVPKSTLSPKLFPSTVQELKCSRANPKSQLASSSPLWEVKGVAQHGHCPFRASWNVVLGRIWFICSPTGRRSFPQISCQWKFAHRHPHECGWHNLILK